MFSLPSKLVKHNRSKDSSIVATVEVSPKLRDNEFKDGEATINREETKREGETDNTSYQSNPSIVTFSVTDISNSSKSSQHQLQSLSLPLSDMSSFSIEDGAHHTKMSLEVKAAEGNEATTQLAFEESSSSLVIEEEVERISTKNPRTEKPATNSSNFDGISSSCTFPSNHLPQLILINEDDLSLLSAALSLSSPSNPEDPPVSAFDDAMKTKILALLSTLQSNESSLRYLLSSKETELSSLMKSQKERELQLLFRRRKETEFLKEKLHRRKQQLSSSRRSLDKKDDELSSLQKTLVQRNQQLRSLQAELDSSKTGRRQLTEKSLEISLLQNDNKIKLQQINSLQDLLEKEKELSSMEKHYSKMIEAKDKEIEEKGAMIAVLQKRNEERESKREEKGNRRVASSSSSRRQSSDGEESFLDDDDGHRDSYSDIDSFSISSDSSSHLDCENEDSNRDNVEEKRVTAREQDEERGGSPLVSALPPHEYMQATRRLNSNKAQFQPQIGPNYQVSSLPPCSSGSFPTSFDVAVSSVDDLQCSSSSFHPDNNDFYEVIWKASEHAEEMRGERVDEVREESDEVDEATRILIEALSTPVVRRSSRLTTISNYPELSTQGNRSSSSLSSSSSSSSFSSSASSASSVSSASSSTGKLNDFLDSIPVSQHICALFLLYSERFDYEITLKKLKEMDRNHPFDMNLRILNKGERETFKQALVRYGDEEWNQVRV
jgi:hypothetical protein